jgi:hypothetical protein
MPHQIPFTPPVPRSKWQSWRTQEQLRFLVVAIANSCPHRTPASAHRKSENTKSPAAKPAQFMAQFLPAVTVTSSHRRRSPPSFFIKSAVPSHSSSYRPTPLVFTAPRAASRWSVAFTAAAEYRPCSAVSRDGDASVARPQKFTSSCGQIPARHNPSLNHRTRYGGLSWPGLGYAVHFPGPGQAIPPHRAG